MLHSAPQYYLPYLIVGLVLLLFGRSLFWLLVAVTGFVVGVECVHYLAPHQTESFTLVVSLILGVLGALLALFLQKLAVLVAGFLGGGYVAMMLGSPVFREVGMRNPGDVVCFLVGGILGAILLYLFFNWALIIFSSMHGALLMLRGFTLPRHYHSVIYLALVILGIVIQASTYRRKTSRQVTKV